MTDIMSGRLPCVTDALGVLPKENGSQIIKGLAPSRKGTPQAQGYPRRGWSLRGNEQRGTKNIQKEVGSPSSRDVRTGLPYI